MKIKMTCGACLSMAILLLTSTAIAQDRTESLPSIESQRRQQFEQEQLDALNRERKDLIDQVRGASSREQLDSYPEVPVPPSANQNPQWAFSTPEPIGRMPSNFGAISNLHSSAGLAHFPSRRDSKLMKINNQYSEAISQLVADIKKSEEDEEKVKLKSDLGEMLGKQYDAYLDHHEEPLKQLEARLEKLREEFESRKSAKADLVKLRLDTIWYDAIGLGWPGNNSNNRTFNSGRFAQPGYIPNQVANPSWQWQKGVDSSFYQERQPRPKNLSNRLNRPSNSARSIFSDEQKASEESGDASDDASDDANDEPRRSR